MKKIKLFTLLSTALILCACTISQTTREDVSFEGLKSFYVENPQGGADLFKKYEDRVTTTLVDEIVSNLTKKGFVKVAQKQEAQMVIKPIWNVAMKSAIQNMDTSVMPFDIDWPATNRGSELYATLEIQVFRKSDNVWGWRGFSPIETNVDNFTSAMLKNQVTWALEKFPPEKYGNSSSILDIFKSSNVTVSEIESKEKEVAIAEENKAELKRQARVDATKKAQEKIQKSAKEHEQVKAPTEEQIQAEMQPTTIAESNAAFDKALKKRAKK